MSDRLNVCISGPDQALAGEFGGCRLGDLFANRRERGRAGLPLLSVTQSDGLVNREDIERKQDTALTPDEHLLVRPGDIAYNMMRMWQGAFGLACKEGLVSPAYVVLAPKAGADSKYLSFLLRSPRTQYMLWAYSYGITDDRLRLYYQDFAKIPVALHRKSDQLYIADLCSASEDRITLKKELLDNTTRLRAGTLNRLLQPKSKAERVAWREFEFGELVTRVRSSFVPSKEAQQSPCIELENVESAIGQLIGQSETNPGSSVKNRFESGDVLFGKLRPYLKKYWVADRGGVCSSEFWVLRTTEEFCSPEFLACLLQSDNFMRAVAASAGSKMPRAEWDYVVGTPLSVPPRDKQDEICRVIQEFDMQIRQLRDYITLIEAEHKGILSKIFRATAAN